MEIDSLVRIIDKPTWKSLLVNTVREEEMDPWSIDVTMLASKYAERIREMRINDFRVPANAVLASAILVRFKSDSWQLLPKQEMPEEEQESLDDFLSFESPEMPEVEATQRITTRRVTLEELIESVEQVMDKTRKKKKRAIKEVIPREIMQKTLGEKEEFEKQVNEIFERVVAKADSENLVLFSDLLEKDTRPEVIKTLLSLLHLANERKVNVWQEKEFGEIFIALTEVKK